MSYKIVCDRCQAEEKLRKGEVNNPSGWETLVSHSTSMYDAIVDLCPKCVTDMERFMEFRLGRNDAIPE